MFPVTVASFTLSLLAQAAPAATPPAPAPVSLTVSIGRGKTYDDEGAIGPGTSVGAGIEWRFRPKWSVGGEVERLGHHRDVGLLEWSGRTVFAGVNVLYRFAARGITPYVGGGFGGVFHEGETVSRFTPVPITTPRSSASTMEYGTVGVEIPIGDHLAVSPDFRITFCQAPDDAAPFGALRFAVKGSYRF